MVSSLVLTAIQTVGDARSLSTILRERPEAQTALEELGRQTNCLVF